MQRIGVFVCHCGSNIAATVDVSKVAEMALMEPGVVHAEDYQYMCSEAGQAKIADAIHEKKLTGIVVCSCSPRMHEATFRKAAERAGLNPYMVEIANIREHCSWIHKDMEEATKKAVILMRAAVAKVNLNTPLQPGESRVTKRALIIGGGIAGIQTALDIADAGYEVDIVEKTPSIGGRMSQLDKTFPTLDCSACILTPKMVEASAHEKIKIYTYSEVENVSGFVGDFTVDIRKKARSVDMDKCTGCGVCQEKCPSKKAPSEFNRGLNNRSAIYTPFAQAIPNVPVIDREACIKFKTGKCGICSKVCQAGAIDYEQKDEIITEKYGAIVVATGFDTINLDKYDEYAYSQSKDVITSLELERVMNAAGPTHGHLERLSDGKAPKEMVFIQCVGSRCSDDRGKPYCSKICCMYTAKHAMLIRDKYPDVNVTVFYIDVRTPGKNFDEFYRRAVEQYGVNYIKGQVGKVIPQPNGKLLVQGSDLLDNRQILKEADMVVLATAIEPNPDVRKIATMLTASIDNSGGGCNMSIEKKEFRPKIVAFCCNWCSYAGADLAGSSRLGYPADVKIIRVPCSCRVNPMFILRAFEKGADGVIMCGCHPGDCHYSTGNFYARRRMTLLFSMLDYIGVENGRTRVEWVSAAEGVKFSDTMNSFVEKIYSLGENVRLGDLRCRN